MWRLLYLIFFKSKFNKIIYKKNLFRDRNPLPKFNNVNAYLLIKEWTAHDEMIVDISQISSPYSFMTFARNVLNQIGDGN